MDIKSTLTARKERLWDWYYANRKQIILGGIVFWVALLSFGLGYLANRETSSIPILIEKCAL